jgi:ankyrin repeat protein
LSEKLSTHPPLPKRIHQISLFAGEAEHLSLADSKPNKIWIWLLSFFFILTVLIGGSVYAIKNIDTTTLMNEIEMNLNLDPSPLINAVVEADIKQVNALLENGADPYIQDTEGWTALHWAVKDMNADITKVLLHAGADPNLMDYYDETPLMKAAYDGHAEMVKLLIQAGSNIDEQDYDGWTPLTYAVHSGDIETFRVLLDAGANPNHRDYSNSTALMHAIKLGNDEIVNLLRNFN